VLWHHITQNNYPDEKHTTAVETDYSKWAFPTQCCRNYGQEIINPFHVKNINSIKNETQH
jgi:hypothetical protein